MMNSLQRHSGFTLIELMLSMTFVSMLLIAVAMCTIQITNIYQRGLTLKEVNQQGRAIVSMLQEDISATVPSRVMSVNLDGGYRLCLGNYSYIINYAAADFNASNVPNHWAAGVNKPVPRMVRVMDTQSEYCTQVLPALEDSDAGYKRIVLSDDPVELLSGVDRQLAIHPAVSLIKGNSDASVGQRLFTVTFVLGTSDMAAIDAGSATCKPPSDADNNLTYCALNDFAVTARAGNA